MEGMYLTNVFFLKHGRDEYQTCYFNNISDIHPLHVSIKNNVSNTDPLNIILK